MIGVSVITVARNAASTIEDTLRSVDEQTYPNIEHILIDGASTDGTVPILRRYERVNRYWISEADRGTYDAMNKGIERATGDVLGFLNADDLYAAPDIVQTVAGAFEHPDVDACYGDLVYVRYDNLDRIVRYFRAKSFSPSRLRYGEMPPHPTLFIRRGIFKKWGLFRTDYRIAADYELVLRIFSQGKIRALYLPRVMVKMRVGGISTRSWRSNILLNEEILRACRENGVPTSRLRIYLKYATKIFQIVQRPSTV